MASTDQELSFHRKLRQEVELWLKEDLITPEQKETILARYQILKEADEKAAPGKLITTLSVLGSILVGIGIILFIASNWSEIPRWGKLFIIFSSMSASYALGFYLRYERENYPRVGASLFLLGSIIFGAGIFLIAQIYHLTVHYPNGLLMWGVGVLPLAYLVRLRTLLSLTIIVLLIWLGMEANFRVSAMRFWGIHMYYITLYLMAGIALWAMGLMHGRFKPLQVFSISYLRFGSFLVFLGGFILTFESSFRMTLGSYSLMTFYMGISGLFVASLILYASSKDKERGWLPETFFLCVVMALVLSLSLIYDVPHTYLRDKGPVQTMALISNIIFAISIIGIIYLGYMRRNNIYINIGLFFFILDVFARYFDFFWKLLPRSVFFIIGGLMLLIGGVVLEKKRRKVLASFNIEEAG